MKRSSYEPIGLKPFKTMAEKIIEKQTEAGRRNNAYGFGKLRRKNVH